MSSPTNNSLQHASISELFALLKEAPSQDTKLVVINELHRRGYSDDDIEITLR